ncbi:DUF7249 family protein [Merismopedia glauca]|uniref:Uncharacterized protein n=1 Tax=Merismopedia glauca CCAP 1448/3 TaxID=1296344 RepID=A0A2T1BWW1_9CYAN|nr:hypothetical protein [Merismopedia glauca]PSB00500.1 hypothetical protein C7B64_23155 [Merismopedia glauca CCAP 1448/3]
MNNNYNGWMNYETWVTALWIDNDQSSYYYSHELTKLAQEEHSQKQDRISYLATLLKDWIQEMNPLADDANLFSDLLNAALSEVNWGEIAENFLTDSTVSS